MSMKGIFIPASLLGLAVLSSCSDRESLTFEQSNANDSYIQAIATPYENETRSVITPTASGYSFKWSTGDKIAVYASGDYTGLTNFDLVDGIDSDYAIFKGSGFKMIEGESYYAFTPYNGNCTDKTNISLDYNGQCQVANNNYMHLGSKDFQVAAAQEAPALPDYPTFTFMHVGALTRFVINLPSADVYTQVTFTSPGMITKGSYNLVSGSFTPASDDSHTMVLDLGTNGEGINMSAESTLTLYMMMAPQDLSGETIDITLTTLSGGSLQTSVVGKNLVSAKPYGFNATVIPDYLCFTALVDNTTISFGRFKGAGYFGEKDYNYYPTLEYSRDGLTWQNYTIDEKIVLNAGDKVYWRGDNTTISKKWEPGVENHFSSTTNYNKFFSTGGVAGSGNVMSLLDKTCKSTTITGEECFAYLFSDRFYMSTSPKLPATVLSEGCYRYMFAENMGGLESIPDLPATTLARECYYGMFAESSVRTRYGNDLLLRYDKDIVLPATVLAEKCYAYMFAGFEFAFGEKVVLPATQILAKNCYFSMFFASAGLTDDMIPELPATTLAEGCYQNMFCGCLGITKTPELPATTLVKNCYSSMFNGCIHLSEVRAAFTTTPGEETTESWLYDTAADGTFYKNAAATWDVTGKDGVPEGWTIKTYTPTY